MNRQEVQCTYRESKMASVALVALVTRRSLFSSDADAWFSLRDNTMESHCYT